jgi:hypothetical protein
MSKLIHNTGEFEETVLSTINFILNVEKPSKISIKYDDLEIETSMNIRHDYLRNHLQCTFTNCISILHKPSNCKITVNTSAFDLHNVLIFSLSYLNKEIVKSEVSKISNDKNTESDKEESCDVDKKRIRFCIKKWQEMLKSIG